MSHLFVTSTRQLATLSVCQGARHQGVLGDLFKEGFKASWIGRPAVTAANSRPILSASSLETAHPLLLKASKQPPHLPSSPEMIRAMSLDPPRLLLSISCPFHRMRTSAMLTSKSKSHKPRRMILLENGANLAQATKETHLLFWNIW